MSEMILSAGEWECLLLSRNSQKLKEAVYLHGLPPRRKRSPFELADDEPH